MSRIRRSKGLAEFLREFRADLNRITLEVGGLEELAVRYGIPRPAKEEPRQVAVAPAEPPEPVAAPVAEPAPEAVRPAARPFQPGPPPAPPPSPKPAVVPAQPAGTGPARPEPANAPPGGEPAPPRSWRSRVWAGGALAGIIAVAGAWRACAGWEAAIESRAHRVFQLPFTQSALLAGDGRRLFTVDPVRSLLFTIDSASLKVGTIQKVAGHRPGGLAWWDGSLWSTDSEAGRIVEHEADAALSVRRAFTNPESRPASLYVDGRHLWTNDARTETISQYSVGDTLKLVRQYTLTGVDPIGLHVDRELLWVMDRTTQRVLRYRPKSLLETHDTLDFAAWLPPRSQVTGFTVVEGVVWIVTEDPAEVHGFDLALLDGLRARRRARSLFGGGR